MSLSSASQRMTVLMMMLACLVTSCASSTTIRSTPPGARVYIDGENVGVTPYLHRDTSIVGSTKHVRLKLDGYEDYSTSFTRSEEFSPGACAGGVFVLVPFLWIMDYKPEHSYELAPLQSKLR